MPLPTPKEAREMWATRLEANPGRQGRGWLAPTDDTRCCLGELCDMAVELGVIDRYAAHATLRAYPDVMELVGLSTYTGVYEHADNSLATDNDNGVAWPEIATIIRAEPEGLFTS